MMVALPAPPALDGVTWRPATVDDVASIVELQDACFEIDQTYREVESEILERFEDTDVVPEHDTLLAVTDDGAVLASIWSYAPSTAETLWRAFGDIHVDPDHRAALDEFAIDWWEARSRQRLAERPGHLPKVLWFGVYAHRTDRIALLESRGFQLRRYYDELIRDLSKPVEERPLLDGVTLVPADEAGPGDELYVHNEAFRDHWGSQPFTEERWAQFHNEFYLPEASYVAYDGADAVGHIFCTKYPHDFDDRGFTHSWIESLGVIASHRGRGLASALIARSLGDFVFDGMEYAVLDVDSENPTGAYGVYERQGFVLDRRSVAMLKDVES